jgi:hypothetical protein
LRDVDNDLLRANCLGSCQASFAVALAGLIADSRVGGRSVRFAGSRSDIVGWNCIGATLWFTKKTQENPVFFLTLEMSLDNIGGTRRVGLYA